MQEQHVAETDVEAKKLFFIESNRAEEGGATVFPIAGEEIKYTPEPGSILLFTYNPDPEKKSYHSACPVVRGFKTTATQWYRVGLSEDKPWDSWKFNWIEKIRKK